MSHRNSKNRQFFFFIIWIHILGMHLKTFSNTQYVLDDFFLSVMLFHVYGLKWLVFCWSLSCHSDGGYLTVVNISCSRKCDTILFFIYGHISFFSVLPSDLLWILWSFYRQKLSPRMHTRRIGSLAGFFWVCVVISLTRSHIFIGNYKTLFQWMGSQYYQKKLIEINWSLLCT